MSIYQQLQYDPFMVAHRLAMPAALFEAFKKTMLGGQRGGKSIEQDYQEAIVCLLRFHADFLTGQVTMPEGQPENDAFIEDVEADYDAFWTQQIKTLSPSTCQDSDKDFTRLSSAHYAGAEILSWFKSGSTFADQPSAGIQEASDFLTAALANLR